MTAPAPAAVPGAAPASGDDSGWSARLTRFGQPRPGPAARRAHRFGVPVVPMLVAGLVAAALLTVRGEAGQETRLEGRPGDPSAVSDEGRSTGSPYGEPGTLGGTRSDDATPLADTSASRTSLPDTPDTPTAGTPSSARSAPGTPGDGGPSGTSTPTGRTTTPKPSRTGAGTPARRPTSAAPPTGDRPGGAPVSFEHLRVGDCFDIDRATPGTALRRACDRPHHAELVARPRLTGRYATDQAIREAATQLCRAPLSRKAARQPLGTRWTTFVQYPYRTSHLLGSVHAACSLAAPSGDRFSHRLR
ncbi:hypothetical protein [Streptomyces sp. NPDC094049]|uniref:hypothetical protein n=1 Tax=Streptomyces sp. NPDC094049 TaxID=3154987 RepID=UPI00331E205C